MKCKLIKILFIMKKLFLAIVAVMMSAPIFAQFNSGGFSIDEEHLYFGVRIGVNFSGISGDVSSANSRTGMTLGGVVGLRVSEDYPVFLESGGYYTERGGNKLTYIDSDKQLMQNVKGHANYLEVPLLIKYGIALENNIAILPFIGPYLALGATGDYKALKRPEMGFKLGCGAEWNNLYLEALYNFGVTNIADVKHMDYSSHGHAFSINFGVNF